MRPKPWSDEELDAIIDDYLVMLIEELHGRKVAKAEHRRALLPKLVNRSEGSIEWKHQNISAVFHKLGLPYIQGYKPGKNIQRVMTPKIFEKLSNKGIDQIPIYEYLLSFVNKKVLKTTPLEEPAPVFTAQPASDSSSLIEEDVPTFAPSETKQPTFKAVKIDFAAKESQNRKLGEAGEQLAINFEEHRLAKLGRTDLVEQIRWISKELGDGAGYDILSFEENGDPRYIEVKTTRSDKTRPFLISENELRFAQIHDGFYLYRIYDLDDAPKIFIHKGPPPQSSLRPKVYSVHLNTD